MFRARVFLAALVIGSLLLSATPALAAPAATGGGSGCSRFYVVQMGDNLYRIALRFHTTTYNLMTLNGLANPNFVYAGQTLCVSAGAPRPFGYLYVVQRGDTLYSIAARNGLSAWYLASVNHLYNPNYIYCGQVLLIPYRGGMPLAPAPAY